ncbi:HopJ type III effector protein [Piscinibacter terrae]|uniref:Type III effector n=1 Tax=Piscinibacter terrae TaxID=2496871 RepID=A0A3N7K075_9BURK|nr:HopJ type III effector protein [Albitalea terrae]RQP26419.1 type III effector [Albitalea terrae]
MNLDTFLTKLQSAPASISFDDTMAAIASAYDFTPTAFTNGGLRNEAGQNSRSCQLFAFAKLQGLSPDQTLACYGAYYRDDVLKNPQGTDHMNIRNFMKHGWEGVGFEGEPLQPRA